MVKVNNLYMSNSLNIDDITIEKNNRIKHSLCVDYGPVSSNLRIAFDVERNHSAMFYVGNKKIFIYVDSFDKISVELLEE